jgi:hypothetical protein
MHPTSTARTVAAKPLPDPQTVGQHNLQLVLAPYRGTVLESSRPQPMFSRQNLITSSSEMLIGIDTAYPNLNGMAHERPSVLKLAMDSVKRSVEEH